MPARINDITGIEGIEVKVKGDMDAEVTGCYVSDLLSDVLASSKDGELWITRQTHPNVAAVASVRALSGVIITGGRAIEPETLKKAQDENLTIMSTGFSTFEVAGKVYEFLKGK